MEEKIKRKIEVTIAGITMSLVTDESDSFVDTVVKRMDETMSALLNRNMKRSQLDAAMLCAIEFCGDKILAEKKVRNLEAQISLYDVNLRRLKEENLNLRKKLEGEKEESADKKEEGEPHVIGEQISIGESDGGSGKPSSDKPGDSEPGDGESAGQSADGSEVNLDSASRDDKLKMIEALLKK